MPVPDLIPTATLIDDDAPRFAARMTRGGRLGVLRLPYLEDAWGGIEAGQPELVLEALLSMLDNGIVVYLAYRDVEVAEGVLPIEALGTVEPALAEHAWALTSEAAGTAAEVHERLQRVMRFVEFELGIMGPVPSWAGQVSEEEYLRYRYESVYPAILLARELGALDLFPVPATYLEAALDAEAAGHVSLRRVDGRGV